DTTNVADYIIVTHYDFLNNKTTQGLIQDFAEWRVEHNQFDVGIVKMQDVYTQFPSITPDSAAQLRDFLIYVYNNWQSPSMPDDHFAYCLFIGDWDYVPTKLYTYTHNTEDWLGAKEGYFRNLITGSKDDIMLGRWPVKETKVQDLVTIAQKTINYEQSPTLGDWRRRGFLIAAIGAGFNFDRCVTLLRPYFSDINYDTLVTRYSQIRNDPLFLSAIDSNLNAGEIVTTYCGHGGPAGWWGRDMGAHYSSSWVKKLKNDARLPVVLSAACFTAMFQWDHPFYDSTHSFPADTSFGEHFLIKQNGGAVAFWGATESVSGGAVDILTALERMLRKQNWILGMCLVGTEKVCLLGDPALDLGDYTAYPNLPDLVVRPRGIDISLLPPYPYLSSRDTIPIQSTVWNIGGTAAYDVDVRFRVLCNEQFIYDTTVTIDTILPRDSVTVTVYWNTGLTHPNYYGEIGDCEFKVRADPNHSIQESWEYNNESMIIKNVAIYPHQPGWPKKVTGFSQPAIANLDGAGSIEIVYANLDSVYVYNYDGSVFSGWPQYFKNVCGLVLGDVDNNNTIEIVAVSNDTIKVYDYQGNILTGWPKAIQVADYYFRGLPAIGCIDSAASPEIIVLAVNTEVEDRVKIYVYTPDGVLQHEFNSSYGSRLYLIGSSVEDVKSGGIDEIVLSYESTGEFYTEIFNKDGLVTTLNYGSNRVTSALVDINNDNYADVITGSNDGKIRAYDVENDRLLWERQTVGPINCSPAVGDIHPGVPYPGVEITFGNDASEIHLRRGVNGVNIDPWPYVITPSTYVWTSPAIANINGDDYLDIIIGDNKNYIYAFKHTKDSIPPFPLPLFGQPSSPLIGDIDGDKRSEVIISSSDGYLHVWENRNSEVTSYLLEWPQFHHDYKRTGLFGW
ncbi:PQQ-binding-like beta-propeller repeat protein, partial [candidate division WOR-3 bacterium]|nr:PQQ-binding-like beta-propeller repeat protein [candidate division WOR-3 bacterium]